MRVRSGSGVAAASAVRWNLSYDVFDGHNELSPDIPVQLTHRDYAAGRAPVLEATLRLIRERGAEDGDRPAS